jgi:hypothetical protein
MRRRADTHVKIAPHVLARIRLVDADDDDLLVRVSSAALPFAPLPAAKEDLIFAVRSKRGCEIAHFSVRRRLSSSFSPISNDYDCNDDECGGEWKLEALGLIRWRTDKIALGEIPNSRWKAEGILSHENGSGIPMEVSS